MSTSHRTKRFEASWPLAGVAGLAAGLVRPIAVAALTAAGIGVGPLELTLQHDLPFWWAIHLAYSFAFGAIYGVVASRDRLRAMASEPATGLLAGAFYGILLWVTNVLVLWTLLTGYLLPVMGSDASPFGPLVGHLVYGVVLGALYPILARGRR